MNAKMQNAFTLIEVMLVVAIIAILATLALPSQLGRITQQKIIETIDLVAPYKPKIVNSYRANSGKFPDDNLAAGIPEADKIKGKYLNKVEVRDGAMHLYLGQNLSSGLNNKIISLRPVFIKDSLDSPVSWVCGYEDIPDAMQAAGTNLTDVDKFVLPGRCR